MFINIIKYLIVSILTLFVLLTSLKIFSVLKESVLINCNLFNKRINSFGKYLFSSPSTFPSLSIKGSLK